MNIDEPSEIAFAAFYSDCEHEVRPLISGCKVTLICNLCVASDSKAPLIGPPDYSSKVDSIAHELSRWAADSQSSEKLIWVLDHEYSAHGLSFDTLKNGDLAVASAFRAAVQDLAGIQLFAANLTIQGMYDACAGEYGCYGGDLEPDHCGPEDLIGQSGCKAGSLRLERNCNSGICQSTQTS